MSLRKLPLSNTRHQPKLMQEQTNLLQNHLHPTISFGGITHRITPETFNMVRMLRNQKASSYSQPAPPVNTNAAQKHADSEKLAAPRIQHNVFPLNTKQTPPKSDVRTTVSKWLATSKEFEKPPAPAPIADPAPAPAPRKRLGQEHWLSISEDLDLRLKARSEGSKAPTKLEPSSAHANPSVNSSISDRRSHLKILKTAKLTPPNQLNANTDTVVPRSPVTMGPVKKQQRERNDANEAHISEVKEKLEKHKREQEQRERVKENEANEANEAVKATTKHVETKHVEVTNSKGADEAVKATTKHVETKHVEVTNSKGADEAVKATTKQVEVTDSKGADEAVKAKESAKEKEAQLEAAESKKAHEAVTVRVKAKKLAADAMARHTKEQERKRYVEGRARDIHENLLLCRPFDVDAVRREFSEKEVQDIKGIVRALAFAKMK